MYVWGGHVCVWGGGGEGGGGSARACVRTGVCMRYLKDYI